MTVDLTRLKPYLDALRTLPDGVTAAAQMRAYSALLETLGTAEGVHDAARLPFAKEVIARALVVGFLALQNDPEKRRHLEAAYVYLALFQHAPTAPDAQARQDAEMAQRKHEVEVWRVIIEQVKSYMTTTGAPQ